MPNCLCFRNRALNNLLVALNTSFVAGSLSHAGLAQVSTLAHEHLMTPALDHAEAEGRADLRVFNGDRADDGG